MNDIKITLTPGALDVLLTVMENAVFVSWETDYNTILHSIKDDLSIRLKKKRIEARPSQKIKFKHHEAIALHYMLTNAGFLDTSYEENERRILIANIDQKL